MRTRVVLIAFIATLTLSIQSCKDKATKLQEEIADLEAREVQNGDSKAELNQKYELFAREYPNDDRSKTYLENATLFNQLTNNYEKAIELGQLYNKRYPESENKSAILISMGKAYAGMNEYDQAITQFEAAEEIAPLANADQRVYGEAFFNKIQDTTLEHRDEHLLKYVGIVEQAQGPNQCVPFLQSIYTDYPKSKYAPFAMMKHESIMEENGDIEGAKKMLERIIAEYPESNFARDAEHMLENDLLGKSAEEQLEAILSKKK